VNDVLANLRTQIISQQANSFVISSPSSPDNAIIVNHYTDMIDSDHSALITLNTSSSMTNVLGASGLLGSDLSNINATIQTTIRDALIIGMQLDIIVASLNSYVAKLSELTLNCRSSRQQYHLLSHMEVQLHNLFWILCYRMLLNAKR
jgi:hypothetical protein